jgi:hypothetical protein
MSRIRVSWMLVMVGCGSIQGDGSPQPVTFAGTDTATFIACRTDDDCPQPEHVCQSCFDGTMVCARSQCGNGDGVTLVDGRWQIDSCSGVACPPRHCVDSPGWCPGPVSDPCANKSCGDVCEQCNTPDGGCYLGTCNFRGACRAAAPNCSPDVGQRLAEDCRATDAVGIGDCNYLFGWSWEASGCVPVVGCSCQGSDCSKMFKNLFSPYCAGLSACPRPAADAAGD